MTEPEPAAGSPPLPPGYENPARGGGRALGDRPVRNGLGTAALVLGILAILTCWTVVGGIVFGVLGLVFGLIGRSRGRRAEATNGGAALAGAITGAIGLLLSIALITFGVSLLNTKAGHTYQDCLRSAGSDGAARQSCAQQFKQQLGQTSTPNAGAQGG